MYLQAIDWFHSIFVHFLIGCLKFQMFLSVYFFVNCFSKMLNKIYEKGHTLLQFSFFNFFCKISKIIEFFLMLLDFDFSLAAVS
jgi:hypothetical protein